MAQLTQAVLVSLSRVGNFVEAERVTGRVSLFKTGNTGVANSEGANGLPGQQIRRCQYRAGVVGRAEETNLNLSVMQDNAVWAEVLEGTHVTTATTGSRKAALIGRWTECVVRSVNRRTVRQ